MDFIPYGGQAALLAAELVNDAPHTDPAVQAWAERLRPVFTATDLDEQVRLVNALLADAASGPYVSRHDGKPPHLHFAHETADKMTRLRGFTAAGVAHVLCEDARRLGHCARPGCKVVFVDTSRNGLRRFCDTRCANRVYVATYRARTDTA